MWNRIMGVATLKAPVYREIAKDTTATGQATIIVIVVAIINGILGAIAASALNATLAQSGLPTISPVGSLLSGAIGALVAWLIGAVALAFVAKQFFKGQTDTSEMLRVTGYTTIFTVIGAILGLIPCVAVFGSLIAVVLQLIGNVIGIREAAGVDTTKAIFIAIIAAIVIFVVILVVGIVIGAIFGVGAALTNP